MPCTDTDGMENPLIITDENINTPEGSEGSLRPGDDEGPLEIPPPGTGPEPEVIIELTNENYPEPPLLGDITPLDTDNIESFTVYYKPPGSTVYEPVDDDEDGIPDVRSFMVFPLADSTHHHCLFLDINCCVTPAICYTSRRIVS